MYKLTIKTLICLIAGFLPATAATIHIPADFPTIQEGIDYPNNHYQDTILVHPGIYEENIVLNGDGLIIASLFITTGDTFFIDQTIIDGGGIGPVFYMNGHDSHPYVIMGFTVRNGYFASGGGFHGNDSYYHIFSNVIEQNEANQDGGAIALLNSSGVIEINKIVNNSCLQRGGGIYIENSSVFIQQNIIDGNTGCGIYWNGDYTEITDNTISNNIGGGFRSVFFSGVLNRNIIYNNTVQGYGGGIYVGQNNSIYCRNNTIVFNNAENGGGVYCDDDIFQGVNNIIYANQADDNPQLGKSDEAHFIMSFSLIEGGWNGEGNIDADPLFVDQDDFDFHLQSGSPCIDSGNPSTPEDPDETRSDMGALYFDQSIPIVEDQSQRDSSYGFWFDSTQIRWQEFFPTLDNLIEIELFVSKIGAPGNLIFQVLSDSDELISADTISENLTPLNGWLEIRLSDPAELSPGESHKIQLLSDQLSPSPENRYVWRGSLNSDYPGINDVFDSWPNYDYAFVTYGYPLTEIADDIPLPKSISLFQNYPNPFNSGTSISYTLSKPSRVTLEIYDILGRKVSTLVNSQQIAGYHQVNWIADDFSTGMYFYKLQAANNIETKKMLLLK
ncbi:MAG: T9SS type A sorting domain-containing protein [candidate division Zixibacteria bacterium]|nr:T9SS type A sorting domain-containing protein [candidate division Zixibacteria bacterium]